MDFLAWRFPENAGPDLLQSPWFSAQAFRMSDNQIAAVVELPAETLHEHLSGWGIEVNHDVAAKNNVVPTSRGLTRVQQVHVLKIDLLAQLLLDPVMAAPFAVASLKVTGQPCRIWQLNPAGFINAPACLFQNPSRNIRGKNLPGIGVHCLETGGHDNGHRIGLFSRGTTCAPSA